VRSLTSAAQVLATTRPPLVVALWTTAVPPSPKSGITFIPSVDRSRSRLSLSTRPPLATVLRFLVP
jgi:hypothetical protein